MVDSRIKSWLPVEQMESGVWDQVKAVAELPFVFKHVGVMPDAHVGIGASVGTVVATQGAVVPSIVGVDVGCGVFWQKTSLRREDLPEDLGELRKAIESRIFLGKGKGYDKIDKTSQVFVDELKKYAGDRLSHYNQTLGNWPNQIGSLGSGNHFIELVIDDEGYVGGFIHSGSRGIGNKLAMAHIALSAKMNKEAGIKLPNLDLSYFEEGTQEFDDYVFDVIWCQKFAHANRLDMMLRVMHTLTGFTSSFLGIDLIHHNHNFTQREQHFGEDVWVTRKGAVSAVVNERGLLPTAMGRPSYVVEGLGNVDSFCTAPHGAGRRMSRSKAKKNLDFSELVRQMEGVEWSHSDAFLDEAPDAYKSPNDVLENSKSLITPVGKLRPILNVKGL